MLPDPVATDLAPIVRALNELGVEAGANQYSPESFGNYWVTFSGRGRKFQIVRDRNQYFVEGPPTEALAAWGLDQAFDNRLAFQSALLRWLAA